jgi:hypothetical protein
MDVELTVGIGRSILSREHYYDTAVNTITSPSATLSYLYRDDSIFTDQELGLK